MSDAQSSQPVFAEATKDLIGQIVAGAFNWSDVPHHTLLPGVQTQIATGRQLMLSMFTLAPGALIPLHSHPHEQAGIWLEGEADFAIGDTTYRMNPGDSYLIPGGVVHTVQVLDKPARALDIFSPPREDYLKYRGR